MAGRPYLGADNRARIQVDFAAPGGVAQSREFLIDGGATRSGVDATAAVGLIFRGLAGVLGPTSTTPAQQFLFGGGSMTFDIEDVATGNTVAIKHTGDVLLINQCLMGAEVLNGQGLCLNVDYSAAPQTVKLAR